MCLSSMKYGRPPVSLTSNADLYVYTYVTTEPSVSRQAVGATTTVLYRLHKCLMYSKSIRSFLKQWTLLLSLHFSDFQVRNSPGRLRGPDLRIRKGPRANCHAVWAQDYTLHLVLIWAQDLSVQPVIQNLCSWLMLTKILGRLGLDGGGADQGPTMPVKVDHRPSTINGWVDST